MFYLMLLKVLLLHINSSKQSIKGISKRRSISNESSDEEFEQDIKGKKKKKNKLPLNNAYSAFDPNIDSNESDLKSIFIDNEFQSKTSDSYIVYLELNEAETNKIANARMTSR